MFVYELSGCGFRFRCSHLLLRYRACFEQEVPWHSGNLECRFTLNAYVTWKNNQSNSSCFNLSWQNFWWKFLHRFHKPFVFNTSVINSEWCFSVSVPFTHKTASLLCCACLYLTSGFAWLMVYFGLYSLKYWFLWIWILFGDNFLLLFDVICFLDK